MFNTSNPILFSAPCKSNTAVSAGERLVKSVSIDQVSAGWDKYTQKTESVQTIVSATKKSVEEVEEQLDKLNWFTDETSFNFNDMVQNIGKFTNTDIIRCFLASFIFKNNSIIIHNLGPPKEESSIEY